MKSFRMSEILSIENFKIEKGYSKSAIDFWAKDKKDDECFYIAIIREKGDFGFYVNGILTNCQHSILTRLKMRFKYWILRIKKLFRRGSKNA
jgi:hypothetical protein